MEPWFTSFDIFVYVLYMSNLDKLAGVANLFVIYTRIPFTIVFWGRQHANHG